MIPLTRAILERIRGGLWRCAILIDVYFTYLLYFSSGTSGGRKSWENWLSCVYLANSRENGEGSVWSHCSFFWNKWRMKNQGSHASWKFLDFFVKFSGPGKSWKVGLVLEILVKGPGKSWNFLPAWRRGTPFRLCCSLVHSLSHLLLFITFFLFPFLIHFTYFTLLSIRSLSTRIVPLRFQARGRRRRLNLGLVCLIYDCVICIA